MYESHLTNVPLWRSWLIWGLGAAFFFFMYIARVAPGTMTMEMMTDFHVSALKLGFLSAIFYWPYVLMQLPVGILVDRFGPRRLMVIMVLLCGAAVYTLSIADGFGMASVSRFMLGFGASFAFVSALKLASIWFPPQQLGLFAGLTQASGMLGASVGKQPIAAVVTDIGWRSTLANLSIVFVILAVLIFLIVRDQPNKQQSKSSNQVKGMDLVHGFMTVMRNKQSWIVGMYAGLVFAPTAAFAELWGTAFLMKSYGVTSKTANFAVGLVFIGLGIGGPLFGWFSGMMGKRRPLMFFSAFICTVIISIVILVPALPLKFLYTMLFIFGLCNAGVVLAYAVASEINCRKVAGISMGLANMLSILVGTLVIQPVIGWLLDLISGATAGNLIYTTQDYRQALLVLPLCSILAFLSLFLIKETYCRPVQ